MASSLFLAVGILLGFLFAIAVTLLLIMYIKPISSKVLLPIEGLKKRSSEIRAELQTLEEQLWIYGVDKEEENKKWRRIYRDFASKTINALHSCWIAKDEDSSAKTTYDELITGLKAIGVEEIVPAIGDSVDDTDEKISIRVISGKPPFIVKTVVYPGYQLNSRHLGTTMLLSPAVVQVVGN